MVTSTDVFEVASVPPPGGSTNFSLYHWEKVKARGILPKYAGTEMNDDAMRLEFLAGARMLGLELVDLDDHAELERLAAMKPPRQPLQPQQLQIVDALNAGHDSAVIEVPRRASKTTTVFAWCLGRMKSRPGYQVTFSAQNGVAGSRRLREWAGTLDRITPDPEAHVAPWLRGKPLASQTRYAALFGEDDMHLERANSRGFRIMRGEVGKGIYFDNGSQFLVLKPEADAYRGEAADVSWIDEAQEIDPDEGADLLAGIVPLQDTKVDSKIVLSGTAGEIRVGPFWEKLDQLRDGNPDVGGLDFAIDENTPWELIENEDTAMDLLERTHPGVGTLTTLDKMRKNYRALPRPQWAREYLSLWPETLGARAIPAEQWADAALAKKLAIPERVAFGVAIKPGGSYAAIVAAWRNPKGTAYIELVEHRVGTAWLPERMQELTRKYRGSTVAYDDIAEGKATATESLRMNPRPKLRIQTYRENAAGCVQVLRDLERGKLKHFDQPGLNAAAARAARREVRGDTGVWLWTVSQPGDDITPLDAATRALRNWDQHFAGKNQTSIGIFAA